MDFPPALQWARRPITFSFDNLVQWGLGLPLGIFAWLSFLGMGWAILRKRNWGRHLPLWAFTGLYFVWQSVSWVRSMRYQMLIYPALALFAGWGLVKLWSARQTVKLWFLELKPKLIRITGIVLTVIVVLTTAAWAFAFSRIYTRPQTRVAASRWIYQNIPGALTLDIQTDLGNYLQPLPYRNGDILSPESPLALPFYPEADSNLISITIPHILDQLGLVDIKQVGLTITAADDREQVLSTATVTSEFLAPEDDWQGSPYEFFLDQNIHLSKGHLYYLELELEIGDSTLWVNGSPSLNMISDEGMSLSQPLAKVMQSVQPDAPYTMMIQVVQTGTLSEVQVPYLVDLMGVKGKKDLTLDLVLPNKEGVSSRAVLTGDFAPGEDARGQAYTFTLDTPLQIEKGDYTFRIADDLLTGCAPGAACAGPGA